MQIKNIFLNIVPASPALPYRFKKECNFKVTGRVLTTIILLFSVHPCDQPGKGGCEQICNKKGDEGQCGCNEGFKLIDGKTCEKSRILV